MSGVSTRTLRTSCYTTEKQPGQRDKSQSHSIMMVSERRAACHKQDDVITDLPARECYIRSLRAIRVS